MGIIEHFGDIVDTHSLCPMNNLYNSNALSGEAGEVANVVKKLHMAKMKPEWIEQNELSLPTVEEFRVKLLDELGDQLFYFIRLMKDNDFELKDVMYAQFKKLKQQSLNYGRTFLK